MSKISVGKNNFDGGKCQVCGKYFNEIIQVWNKESNILDINKPNLKICKECLQGIFHEVVKEY